MNFVLTLPDINWLDYRDYIVIEEKEVVETMKRVLACGLYLLY
jgi:hypothetical protein